MILIDASVFVAYSNARDVHHGKALSLLNRIENGEFGMPFTSDYVLNEVVGVAHRKMGKAFALALGKQILSSFTVLHMDERLFAKAWRRFSAKGHSLDLVDCTIAEMAQGHAVATFDKEFRGLSGITAVP